jgi:hypothetical protein
MANSCQSIWQSSLVRTLEAVDNGVRLQRSNSTIDDPKMQGDVTMLGVTQIKAREALKKNSAIRRVICSWFDQLELNEAGELDKERQVSSIDSLEWTRRGKYQVSIV